VNVHKNATLTPRGRAALVYLVTHDGLSVTAASTRIGVSRTTVYRWLRRATAFGDRSSRPRRLARLHPRAVRRRVVKHRARRWSSLRIARTEGLPVATVVTMLRRLGLNRLPPIQPAEPIVRYERAHAGELLHVDVKKLARIARGPGHRIHGDRRKRVEGAGWEYAHVAIDDASRLAYVELLPDETATTATAFLYRALRWYWRRRIRVARLMTDNAKVYHSHVHTAATRAAGIRQIFTRPYRPCTNGKAERFIRTLLTEWAYARAYHTSARRTAALAPYLSYYNTKRPHGGIGFITPQQRLAICR
jgi:transposase InsO family protein